MKVEAMLKGVVMTLVVALAVVVTSWLTAERTEAQADGGGGSTGGNWMMVASELRAGEGLIYMFNTERQVLLIYAYHRGRRGRSNSQFTGDLQLLAGRHCKWDLLYCQQWPYPTVPPKKDMPLPADMKKRVVRKDRG